MGYKGSATALNRRVDCDVLVADVSPFHWGVRGAGSLHILACSISKAEQLVSDSDELIYSSVLGLGSL